MRFIWENEAIKYVNVFLVVISLFMNKRIYKNAQFMYSLVNTDLFVVEVLCLKVDTKDTCKYTVQNCSGKVHITCVRLAAPN